MYWKRLTQEIAKPLLVAVEQRADQRLPERSLFEVDSKEARLIEGFSDLQSPSLRCGWNLAQAEQYPQDRGIDPELSDDIRQNVLLVTERRSDNAGRDPGAGQVDSVDVMQEGAKVRKNRACNVVVYLQRYQSDSVRLHGYQPGEDLLPGLGHSAPKAFPPSLNFSPTRHYLRDVVHWSPPRPGPWHRYPTAR